MASLNPLTRELVFKIVFYGPGLGGKTTTLQFIHATTKPEHRGKMVSLATPTDRTLYFDFLPLRVPRVRGMSVRLQLFTVPGQVYFAATRKLVLSGADGVVFVADSQAGRLDANQESLEDLVANLAEHSKQLSTMPHSFQWNKRDLSDLVSTEDLDQRFNKFQAPSLGTVATRGDGVFEGLERITRLVLRSYEAELPKGEHAIGLTLGGAETSIAEAVRGLAEAPLVSKVTPFAGTPAVQPPGAVPSAESTEMRAAAAVAQETVRKDDHPASTTRTPSNAPVPDAHNGTSTKHAAVSVPAQADVPHAGAPTIAPPPGTSHFSMAELWPEPERDGVRQTETLIGARDSHGAVLACDLLLTRVLASAAALSGPADAPRDPGLVSLLLGMDGARYLAFRAAVRAARQKEEVSIHDALECFSFVLEARRAREAIRR